MWQLWRKQVWTKFTSLNWTLVILDRSELQLTKEPVIQSGPTLIGSLSGGYISNAWRDVATHTHTEPHISISLRPLAVFICLSTPFFFISIFLSEPLGMCSSASSPRQEDEINSLSLLFLSLLRQSLSVQKFLLSTWKHLICLQRCLSPVFILFLRQQSSLPLFYLWCFIPAVICLMVSVGDAELVPLFCWFGCLFFVCSSGNLGVVAAWCYT